LQVGANSVENGLSWAQADFETASLANAILAYQKKPLTQVELSAALQAAGANFPATPGLSLRESLPDNVYDIKDRARETYETASDRLSRATDALAGKEASQSLGKVGALLIGVGIGVGVGLLFAPASGEETRGDIADKVTAFGERMRDQTRTPSNATGTDGD
jgi:hypothetical protein